MLALGVLMCSYDVQMPGWSFSQTLTESIDSARYFVTEKEHLSLQRFNPKK